MLLDPFDDATTNREKHNLNEIAGLSQRGGTLSIVDLISANTLDIDMSAYSLLAVSNGVSFLTAARPGNAGKTTLMACLLTFLPIGTEIVTTGSPSVVTKAHEYASNDEDKLCFLCHEIGSGHWYGYLWGKYVGQLFQLMDYDCQIASCIHADTLSEMRDILVSRELSVSEEDFSRLGLIMFMRLERNIGGYKRRVAELYERNPKMGKHELLFSWDKGTDTFKCHSEPLLLANLAEKRGESMKQVSDKLRQCRAFIEKLMGSGNTDFRWVRSQVVGFLDKHN